MFAMSVSQLQSLSVNEALVWTKRDADTTSLSKIPNKLLIVELISDVLTVFGFCELRAVFGAAVVNKVRTEHVGAAL